MVVRKIVKKFGLLRDRWKQDWYAHHSGFWKRKFNILVSDKRWSQTWLYREKNVCFYTQDRKHLPLQSWFLWVHEGLCQPEPRLPELDSSMGEWSAILGVGCQVFLFVLCWPPRHQKMIQIDWLQHLYISDPKYQLHIIFIWENSSKVDPMSYRNWRNHTHRRYYTPIL